MSKYGVTLSPGRVAEQTASRVKQLRKQAGYSQLELAERSEVSLGSLKRFEQTGKVSLDNLLRLLQVLGRLEELNGILLPTPDLEHTTRRAKEMGDAERI